MSDDYWSGSWVVVSTTYNTLNLRDLVLQGYRLKVNSLFLLNRLQSPVHMYQGLLRLLEKCSA